MKLKRFYDDVSRPFDCSLAVGCQRFLIDGTLAPIDKTP